MADGMAWSASGSRSKQALSSLRQFSNADSASVLHDRMEVKALDSKPSLRGTLKKIFNEYLLCAKFM